MSCLNQRTSGATLLAFGQVGSFCANLTTMILAVLFYNEHWNLQKALAVVLSVVSLALLG